MATNHQPGSSQKTRPPRIAVGGILHETNTFSPFVTTLQHFEERTLLRGQSIIDVAAGSDSTLGGAIDAAQGQADLIPTLFTSAMPGGPVADDTFAALAADLLDRVRRAHNGYPKLSGVVLLLHGAMVTESDSDPEGTLLAGVRSIVGPAVPICVALDSHATLTQRMVKHVDLIASYETYPHVDTRARGREAMTRCLSMIDAPWKPVPALRTLSLLMPLVSQSTDPGNPLSPVLERAAWWRSQRQIAAVSIIPGFPYADVPDAGASVLVYAYDHPGYREYAARAADELAELWWSRRDRFNLQGTPLVALPTEPVNGITVLADIADNPGAGAPGDGTHILRHAIDHDLHDAAFATIFDPAAVCAAHDAGTGNTVRIGIGGKATPLSGTPLEAPWQVIHLGDGVFTNEGPMAHRSSSRIGRTATVRSAGISVILSERRAQALDPAIFRAGGISPEDFRWLVVKSSVHYRAAFRTMANRMIDVECPGLSTSNLRALTYNRVRRPIVPLDAEYDRALLCPDQDRGRD